MASADDFFNLDLLNKIEDEVVHELNSLNDAVCSTTKGNATAAIQPLIEDEVKAYFGDKHYDENYYLCISYINKEVNQKVINKFCVISYSETYPVIVLSLKNKDGIQEFSNKSDFHKYLKKICNEKPVISSLRLSMRKKEHFQEFKPFFCSHKEQFGCLYECSKCKYRDYRVF